MKTTEPTYNYIVKPKEPNPVTEVIIESIKTIYDPELPVNIYDLGLIYSVEMGYDGTAFVEMTLTSPNCPVAQSLPEEVRVVTESVEGVNKAIVEVVWDPPWDSSCMSEEAKLELNIL
jgi:FeS assembly SUF system protein